MSIHSDHQFFAAQTQDSHNDRIIDYCAYANMHTYHACMLCISGVENKEMLKKLQGYVRYASPS